MLSLIEKYSIEYRVLGDLKESYKVCSISLDEFNDDDKVFVLLWPETKKPNAVYKDEGLANWLISKATDPTTNEVPLFIPKSIDAEEKKEM